MLRHDALLFLNSQPALRAYAADTNTDLSDDSLGWTYVIDSTFRELGLGLTDEVPSSKEQDARLLLRYFALEQFVDLYAQRVDLNLALVGIDKKRSQAYRAIKDRLEVVQRAVERLGYLGGGDHGVTLGRVTLDYIEPWSPLSY